MGSTPKPIVFDDLRGGRNDTDPPMKLPMNQATEFLNMDWKDATFGRKRGGSTAVSQTGGTAFSLGVQSIGRHVPGADEAAAELWATDGAATPITKRLTAGTTWADVTFDDAISTRPQDVVSVTLNGKRFVAYDSTVDRLHVYDPNLAAPRVRRVNINPGAVAPTVANTGAGAYAATLRYYRVRFMQYNGVTVFRKSEPTPSVSFTPSGAGTAARITRPTAPGEGETHWFYEASTDNTNWYAIALVVIATTTADDSLTSYTTSPISHVLGVHSLFPSVKSLMTDGNRLLGAGSWETAGATSGGKNSRVWFTPVLGSTDEGDDEQIPNTTTQKNWIDLNENDGGGVTGLGGPINGVPWAFKYRQVWKLRPTGDVSTPYLPRKVVDGIGCIEHKSIAMGEDHAGQPALYFMSHRGPYRITLDGAVQYLGRDNEVTWRSMNLGATTKVCHSTYYPDLHQWWVWIATGSNNDPDTKMMFDVQRGFPDENGQIRGGWAKHTGDSAAARCSCLFANTLGASMSKDLKPYLGRSSGTVILKCDTSDTDDNGTQFQGTATTRPVQTTSDLMRKVGIDESILVAKAASDGERDDQSRLRQRDARSVGESRRGGTETRVVAKVEGSEMGEANVVQMTVGDSAASTATWTIDALITPVKLQESR
jgi:hypothetical protein